jgi:hypothetical protein
VRQGETSLKIAAGFSTVYSILPHPTGPWGGLFNFPRSRVNHHRHQLARTCPELGTSRSVATSPGDECASPPLYAPRSSTVRLAATGHKDRHKDRSVADGPAHAPKIAHLALGHLAGPFHASWAGHVK